MKAFFALTAVLTTTLLAQEAPKPPDATLTLYSPRQNSLRTASGERPWVSPLWIDNQRVTTIKLMPGHFLSLKLLHGGHKITGWNFWGRESDAATTISLEPGKHYFVRLMDDSHVVAGWSGVSDFGEVVTCDQAYRDGSALEPVKLKHVTEQFVDSTVRESFFPQCEIR